MKLLAQENFVEEVLELVAVRAEPVLATAFPMQCVRVAQERNACNAFCITQASERFKLAVRYIKANGIPRKFNVLCGYPLGLLCHSRQAFLCDKLAKILRAHPAKLVIFHQLVDAPAFFKFCGGEP